MADSRCCAPVVLPSGIYLPVRPPTSCARPSRAEYITRLMVLVGQQMLRQLHLADSCPHDAGAAQGAFQAIPGPRIAAQDVGQGPVRDGELAPEERPFDILGACGPVGHQGRGPDAVSAAVAQDDATDGKVLFGRDPRLFQLVSVPEVPREEFG